MIYYVIYTYIYIYNLQRCNRKAGMKGKKRFAMRGCLWLRNLEARLSQQYQTEKAWERFGCPKGLKRKRVLHVSHCFRTWMLPLRSNAAASQQ